MQQKKITIFSSSATHEKPTFIFRLKTLAIYSLHTHTFIHTNTHLLGYNLNKQICAHSFSFYFSNREITIYSEKSIFVLFVEFSIFKPTDLKWRKGKKKNHKKNEKNLELLISNSLRRNNGRDLFATFLYV